VKIKPRIAVIGAGDNAANSIRIIRKRFEFCALMTDVVLDNQWRKRTEGAKHVAMELDCPVVLVDNPDAGITRLHELEINLVIVCGTKWILSELFLDAMKRRVINLHPSRLPSHGGAGVFSWQILNGIDTLSITAHWVVKKIDNGPVIFSEDYTQTKLCTASDFIEAYYEKHPQAIATLLDMLVLDPRLAPPQTFAEHQRTYFPLLDCRVNGALDWTWSLDDLELFLRAFGKPYLGAFSYFGDTKFHIVNWRAIPDRSLHPFCYGLVLDKGHDGSVRVGCHGGYLEIIDICIESELSEEYKAGNLIKVGGRVWVPHNVAEQSRTFRPRP